MRVSNFRSTVRILIIAFSVFLTGCGSTATRSTISADLIERADQAYREGQLTVAEARYREITHQKPSMYEPWFRLGNIYVRTGQLEAAVKMYERCIELRSEDARAWNNLALTRIQQAIAVLDEGVAMASSNSAGWKDMQRLSVRLKQP